MYLTRKGYTTGLFSGGQEECDRQASHIPGAKLLATNSPLIAGVRTMDPNTDFWRLPAARYATCESRAAAKLLLMSQRCERSGQVSRKNAVKDGQIM